MVQSWVGREGAIPGTSQDPAEAIVLESGPGSGPGSSPRSGPGLVSDWSQIDLKNLISQIYLVLGHT